MSAALSVLMVTAADVEVELNGQVLFAECLPGVGEGFGFQPAVQRAQVGRRLGGDAEHELGAGGVANYAAPDGVDAVVASDFAGELPAQSSGLSCRAGGPSLDTYPARQEGRGL
jgi:hypothetical protein